MRRGATMNGMIQPAYTTDTSAEAYAAQLACIRRLPPTERFHKARQMSRRARQMALAAIRRRHPSFDDDAVRLKFIALAYGTDLSAAVGLWQESHRS